MKVRQVFSSVVFQALLRSGRKLELSFAKLFCWLSGYQNHQSVNGHSTDILKSTSLTLLVYWSTSAMSSTTAGRTSDLYSALELKNAGDIRLARIFSNETGKLHCELRVVDLERSPQYLAVSYTWGPSTNEEAAREVTNNPSQSITCNGHDVLITTNLYNFLVRVASKDIARYEMWFDILCINQSDDIERSKQVKMMASIYNSAQLVVIWLGEEDQYTEDAFALVRRLGSLEEPNLKSITPRSMASEATLTLLHPYGDLKYWTAVTKLFQRRYFTRIWIIQEITLARRRLAICGSHEIGEIASSAGRRC